MAKFWHVHGFEPHSSVAPWTCQHFATTSHQGVIPPRALPKDWRQNLVYLNQFWRQNPPISLPQPPVDKSCGRSRLSSGGKSHRVVTGPVTAVHSVEGTKEGNSEDDAVLAHRDAHETVVHRSDCCNATQLDAAGVLRTDCRLRARPPCLIYGDLSRSSFRPQDPLPWPLPPSLPPSLFLPSLSLPPLSSIFPPPLLPTPAHPPLPHPSPPLSHTQTHRARRKDRQKSGESGPVLEQHT